MNARSNLIPKTLVLTKRIAASASVVAELPGLIMAGREAAGDLVLIQTSLLFLYK